MTSNFVLKFEIFIFFSGTSKHIFSLNLRYFCDCLITVHEQKKFEKNQLLNKKFYFFCRFD